MIDTNMEDSESLFGGSPPASPIVRGRSPSPALALPGTSSSIEIMNQNVGTIALPGSQHDIELPINPLALSLSLSQRPPAQSAAFASRVSSMNSMASSSASSRETSMAPSKGQHQGRNARKRKADALYTRPPPPEIPLPDPSGPIPANWLRNQSALFGTAGLVAGLKPLNITHHDARGTTSNNPIVVEDDTPKSTKFAGIPAPSNDQIVRELIQDKEVLQMLHELLTLVAKGGLPFDTEASKRRGMDHRIPAGAAEWDVNQTPDNQLIRCKHLVSELMGHIRMATRKAAIRHYWQQGILKYSVPSGVFQHNPGSAFHAKTDLHSHPSTIASTPLQRHISTPPQMPLSPEGVTAIPHDTNKENEWHQPSLEPTVCEDVPLRSTSLSPPPVPVTDPSNLQAPSLDQLLGSLLTASSDDQTPTVDSVLTTAASLPPLPNIEQWLMDSWMPVFESFPVPADHVEPPQLNGDGEAQPMPDFPLDMDFGLFDAPMDVDAPSHWDTADGEVIPDQFPIPVPSSDDASVFTFPSQSPIDCSQQPSDHAPSMAMDNSEAPPVGPSSWLPPSDDNIDPSLLAENFPPNASSSQTKHQAQVLRPIDTMVECAGMGMPSLGGSPILSSISSSGEDLLTPAPSRWEGSGPEIASASGEEGGVVSGGEFQPQHDVLELAKAAEKGANVKEVLPALISALFPRGKKQVKVARPVSAAPSTKKLSRAEILKEAHARRQLLADAIVQARTKLWETTIEQGVLSHLTNYYNKSS